MAHIKEPYTSIYKKHIYFIHLISLVTGRGYGYVAVSRFKVRTGVHLYDKLRRTDFLPSGRKFSYPFYYLSILYFSFDVRCV